MAPVMAPFSVVLLLLFLLRWSCYSKVQENEEGFEVVELSTLKAANVCTEWKGLDLMVIHIDYVPQVQFAGHIRNSLRISHSLGPCVPSTDGRPNDAQILAQDSLRVAYIENRIRANTANGNMGMDPLRTSLEITLPARHGDFMGVGSYVLTISIGTRKKDQIVLFDTGSSLCWLQCKPCRSCYQQAQPMFDSASSPTYRNITCNDQRCTLLPAYGVERGCTNDTCTYRASYMDSSITSGLLAMERMELSAIQTHPIVLSNFVFGCGQSNRGSYGRTAGLFGLGRGFHSLVTQASNRLGNVFSYCLPSMINAPGYLTIGRRVAPSPVYTTMMTGRRMDMGLYYVDLVGITVSGQRLQLSPLVFQNIGTIIDSGSVITHLPPAAYLALKNAFRRGMSHYPLAPRFQLMDTCYTIGGSNISYPLIKLHFSGLDLQLRMMQTLYIARPGTYCLAFAANVRGRATIIGTTQQRGMEVIYDIEAQRIGFSPGTNCR